MKLHTTQTASYPALVEVPCAAGVEYKIGMALNVTSGAAAQASGTTVPTHICFTQKKGAEGETVQAIKLLKGETFEAPLSVDGAALKIGDKVTIAADGIGVTATTASGIAQIVGFMTEAKAAGDGVLVMF